jgi:hypothetical protein
MPVLIGAHFDYGGAHSDGGVMRLVFGSIVLALVLVSSAFVRDGRTTGLVPPPASVEASIHQAKIVCGNFGNGFTCRNESGTVHRPKGVRPPGTSSETTGAPIESGDPDALPPMSGSSGAGAQVPSGAPASCPANSELLGGHCIPYTQRCTAGIPPSAAPPLCQGEEKQVCKFHPDGSKDCCCRTYSKY